MKVDADTYVASYQGQGQDGFISTFTVSADGTSITEVTQLEHDTDHLYQSSLVQVDSDTYLCAYGNNSGGQISTFTVSADGSTLTKAQTLLHGDGPKKGYWSLVQVDSDTYALAYRGTDNDGYITTFTISADVSTITEVATLEHDTDEGEHNSLVQVDSDTYASRMQGRTMMAISQPLPSLLMDLPLQKLLHWSMIRMKESITLLFR